MHFVFISTSFCPILINEGSDCSTAAGVVTYWSGGYGFESICVLAFSPSVLSKLLHILHIITYSGFKLLLLREPLLKKWKLENLCLVVLTVQLGNKITNLNLTENSGIVAITIPKLNQDKN